jgi:hypothetical protein
MAKEVEVVIKTNLPKVEEPFGDFLGHADRRRSPWSSGYRASSEVISGSSPPLTQREAQTH